MRRSSRCSSRSASARALLAEDGRGAGQGRGAGAALRSRSDVAEAAAERLVSGQTIGVGVDAQDHVWIVHRADSLDADRSGGRRQDRHVLREGAADPRVRSAGQPAAPLGRRGRRRAISGRRRTTASPSTTRATSGSAATAAADGMVLKFTQDGKFLMQVGTRRAGSARQQHARSASAWSPRSRSTTKTNEVYVADGYGNKRVVVHRRRHRQVQALLGRLRQQAGRHRPRRATTRTRRSPQQFRTPVHCAEHVERRPRLRLRSRQRSPAGVHARGQVREGSFGSQPDSLGDGSTWDIAFSKDPQQKYHLPRRRPQREGAHPRSAVARRADQLRRRRQATRASSTSCTASPSTRRATSTRPRPTTAAALQRFLYKGMQTGDEGQDQGTVWPTTDDEVTHRAAEADRPMVEAMDSSSWVAYRESCRYRQPLDCPRRPASVSRAATSSRRAPPAGARSRRHRARASSATVPLGDPGGAPDAAVRPAARRRSRRAAVHRPLARSANPAIRDRSLRNRSAFFVRTAVAATLVSPAAPTALRPIAGRFASAGWSRAGRSRPARPRTAGRAERPLSDRMLGQLRPDQLRPDEHRRLGRRAARARCSIASRPSAASYRVLVSGVDDEARGRATSVPGASWIFSRDDLRARAARRCG